MIFLSFQGGAKCSLKTGRQMRKKISNYVFSGDYLCGLSQIHMKMFKDYSALLI